MQQGNYNVKIFSRLFYLGSESIRNPQNKMEMGIFVLNSTAVNTGIYMTQYCTWQTHTYTYIYTNNC